MHTHTLTAYGEIFAQAQNVTGTATAGNKNAAVEVGDHLGGLAVTFLANGAVTVAAGGKIAATVEHGDAPDGTFATLAVHDSAGMERFAGGFSAADGQPLAIFPLPAAKRFVRVKIHGSGVTGKVDCVLEHLAR